MMFDYFYGNRADQYSFIRIPRRLITGKEFSSLTIQAKMLYGLLLDRWECRKKINGLIRRTEST